MSGDFERAVVALLSTPADNDAASLRNAMKVLWCGWHPTERLFVHFLTATTVMG